MNEETPSTLDSVELIDAAQDVVIKAVDNVSELIAETTQTTAPKEAHTEEVFYLSAEFWVGVAFMLVVAILAKPLGKMLKSMLVKRRDDISEQIDTAEKLHDDAQKLLAEYERKYLNADKEADAVLQKSQRLIEHTKNEELGKLKAELERKRQEADGVITTAEAHALEDINNRISAKAIEIAENYIKNNLDAKRQSALIDASIENITAKLQG